MAGLVDLVRAGYQNHPVMRQAVAQRQANPRVIQETPQQALDLGAGLMSLVPGLGDALGLAADAHRYATEPESRTWGNVGLTAVGALPFVPPMAAIVAPAVAKTLKTKHNLPQDANFLDAVRNTPGAKITEDGLVMNVARSQKPEQGLMPSVRGGVFYLPEGAQQMKHYSTGKHGYGGTDKISGETLFSNPLVVKGATGGKAPEAAYDQLIGKGAYQGMREDALKAVGYNMSHAQKLEAVDKFLSKYAPEMTDLAGDIVQNSKHGNTLPYALQEAAVGAAVRKAGHDGVLGYSVARSNKQPFISEVFDVREVRYPDKFGTPPEIWDAFK